MVLGVWGCAYGLAMGRWICADGVTHMLLGLCFWGDGFGRMALGVWFNFGRMAFGRIFLRV